MKNTNEIDSLLGLMTLNQGDLPPDFEVLISNLLGIDPTKLRYIDGDSLYDLAQDELGIEIYELPFKPTHEVGKPYTTDEESGLYWNGTIGGLPAIQTKCFGLYSWFMSQ